MILDAYVEANQVDETPGKGRKGEQAPTRKQQGNVDSLIALASQSVGSGNVERG